VHARYRTKVWEKKSSHDYKPKRAAPSCCEVSLNELAVWMCVQVFEASLEPPVTCATRQMGLWEDSAAKRYARFWQRRFYDFNVWSTRKKNEKLNYMHFNPVKRGLVERPTDRAWSSCRFYAKGESGVCAPNPGWKYKKGKTRTFTRPNVRHPRAFG